MLVHFSFDFVFSSVKKTNFTGCRHTVLYCLTAYVIFHIMCYKLKKNVSVKFQIYFHIQTRKLELTPYSVFYRMLKGYRLYFL